MKESTRLVNTYDEEASLERPRLKANFSAEIVTDDQLFVISEDSRFALRGAGAVAVLPLLDGLHTVAEIVGALRDRHQVAETFLAIRKFDAFGLLAEGRPDLSPRELAYWDALGVDPAAATRAVSSLEVRVVALPGVSVAPVITALRDAGVQATELPFPGPTPSDPAYLGNLLIVLTNDYLDPALAAINASCLATGTPWMLARPSGQVLWLGPLMTADRTGCWACLEQRLQANRQVERFVHAKGAAMTSTAAPLAHALAAPQILAGMLAAEVERLAGVGSSETLDGRLVTLDMRTLETTGHMLVRRPQCAACGDPALVGERSPKVTLTPQPIAHRGDSGYRSEPPSHTLRRMERQISPYLGAVTSVRNYAEVDNGITYSLTAGHNFALIKDSLNMLKRNLRGQSGGKGRTEEQARVSAVCEAIERYTGVWRGDEPVLRAAYQNLPSGAAIHPDELLHYSDQQFASRDSWNIDPANRLQIVPERFRVDSPIDWTAGWSLTRERERLIPAAYAWFGHPDLDDHFFCISDSNGNAAGNTLEEAILQGFCELAERDAVAIWWYNRLRRPALDLDSLHEPYVQTLRAFYRQQDRDLWLLDITTDLGIPTFAGISRRVGHPVHDVIVGFGAHLDPRVAAMRALTEVNQSLPAVERRDESGATLYFEDDVATLDWYQNTRVDEEPWLVPDPEARVRSLADFDHQPPADLAEAVMICVDRARAAGLEVIVIDQTQPDLDLSVAKVVVPGLRHFWRRLGPGRLYDVPARLGWLPAAQPESALNPKNVYF